MERNQDVWLSDETYMIANAVQTFLMQTSLAQLLKWSRKERLSVCFREDGKVVKNMSPLSERIYDAQNSVVLCVHTRYLMRTHEIFERKQIEDTYVNKNQGRSNR